MSLYDTRSDPQQEEDSPVLNLSRKAIYRPVDWRWERARLAREDPRTASALPPDADEWFRKAKEFQIAKARCRDTYDLLILKRKYPNLANAYYIWVNTRHYLRWELEARLLAGETLERIEERIPVEPAVSAWYEKLFFNVNDRLSQKGWVAHCVLGEALHAGATERDHDLLWKLYGYMGGGFVLDVVIDKKLEAIKPTKSDEVIPFLCDEVENITRLKAMFAARLMPVNTYTQEIILEIYQKFLEIKAQVDGAKGDTNIGSITLNIAAMMENLPWAIGQKRPNLVSSKDPERIVGKLPPPLLEADTLAAELRMEDFAIASLGEEPASMEAMRKIRFPTKKEDSNDDDPTAQQSSRETAD